MIVRLGSRRDMVQPVWAGVTIIVDEVTLSGKSGEIEITAVMLMNGQDPAGGRVSQAAKFAGLIVALDVLAGPGCDATKLPYVELIRQPGDVVISVGSRIYKATDGGVTAVSIVEQCGLALVVVPALDRDQAGA